MKMILCVLCVGSILAEHVVDVLQLFGLVLRVSVVDDFGCQPNAFYAKY